MSELLELRRIECTGTPLEMGRAHGEALRDLIQRFADQRLSALRDYMNERGGARVEDFIACGAKCLAVAQEWDPEAYAEICGIAAGAGLEPELLYAVSNMTDIRDVLLLPGTADREGCTALLVPPEFSANGGVLVGQTWDLNPTDLDYVVAVHRKPNVGLETWSVTCAGSLSLVGMNAQGICVGTTNIKTRASRVGVGYLSILHRALRSRTLEEAKQAVKTAPRAAAHTYWLADASTATEFETDPLSIVERQLERRPIARTNHCIAPALREREGEAPTVSTQKRIGKAEELAAAGPQDIASLQRLFADRSDGVDSINRYTEDAQGTTTNACIIASPRKRELWACRGSADRGAWIELKFSEKSPG